VLLRPLRRADSRARADVPIILELWTYPDESGARLKQLVSSAAAFVQLLRAPGATVWGNPFDGRIQRRLHTSDPSVPVTATLSQMLWVAALWAVGLLPLARLDSPALVWNAPLPCATVDALLAGMARRDLRKRIAAAGLLRVLSNSRLLAALRRAGVPVVLFIVNSADCWRRGVAAGADALQTDAVPEMAALAAGD